MSDTTLAIETAKAFTKSIQRTAHAGPTGEGLYISFALRDQAADWCNNCLDNVDQLRELSFNWDSYGAKPVDSDSIQVAQQLLLQLAKFHGVDCPRVGASPAGHVAFSWEWENHSRELDLEVLPDGTLRYSYLDEAQPDHDREGETTTPDLIAHLLTQW